MSEVAARQHHSLIATQQPKAPSTFLFSFSSHLLQISHQLSREGLRESRQLVSRSLEESAVTEGKKKREGKEEEEESSLLLLTIFQQFYRHLWSLAFSRNG